jgi:hypothetical protein
LAKVGLRHLSSHTKNIPNSHRKNYVNEPKNFQPLQGTLFSFKSEPLALTDGNEGESFPYSLLQSSNSCPLKFNENSKKSTYFFTSQWSWRKLTSSSQLWMEFPRAMKSIDYSFSSSSLIPSIMIAS